MTPPRLLLIDDDLHVLGALTRSLRAHLRERLPGLRLESESDPMRAIDRLHEQSYDLVICAHHLQRMSGVEVLRRLRTLQPGAGRVILSHQDDLDTLRDAISEAHIHCYLGKPWNDAELADAVARTLACCAHQRETGRSSDEARVARGEISPQAREARRLEQAEPGITRVEFDLDGALQMGPLA